MKFRAMNPHSSAPERQPKSSRGENPGNARAGAARNSCTEARPRRSFGQRVYARPHRSDNRNQAAVKIRAMPGQVPREIHAPKQVRDEVSCNVFTPGRTGATTEIRTRRNTGNAGQVPRQICAPKQARDEVSGNVFTPSRAGATTEIKPRRKPG